MSYFDQPALAHRKPLRPSAIPSELSRPVPHHTNSAPVLNVAAEGSAKPTEWPGHHDAHTITVCQSLQTPVLQISETRGASASDYFHWGTSTEAEITPRQAAPVQALREVKAQVPELGLQQHSSPISIPASSPCPHLRSDSITERKHIPIQSCPETKSTSSPISSIIAPSINFGGPLSPSPTDLPNCGQDQSQSSIFLQVAQNPSTFEGRTLALPGRRRGLQRAQSSNAAVLSVKTYLDGGVDKENDDPEITEASRCPKRVSVDAIEPPTPRTALANALSRTHILANPVTSRTPPVKVLPSNWRPAQPPPTGGKHMSSTSNNGRRRAELMFNGRAPGDLPRPFSGPIHNPTRSRTGGGMQRAHTFNAGIQQANSSSSAAAPFLNFELPPLDPLPIFNRDTMIKTGSARPPLQKSSSDVSARDQDSSIVGSEDGQVTDSGSNASTVAGRDLSPDSRRILQMMSRKHAGFLGRTGVGAGAKRSMSELSTRSSGQDYTRSFCSSTSSISSLGSASSSSRRTSGLNNVVSDESTDKCAQSLSGYFDQPIEEPHQIDGFSFDEQYDAFGVDEYNHGQNPFLDGPMASKRPHATSMHSCPSFQKVDEFSFPFPTRHDDAMDLTL